MLTLTTQEPWRLTGPNIRTSFHESYRIMMEIYKILLARLVDNYQLLALPNKQFRIQFHQL